MSIQLHEENGGKILVVHVKAEPVKADYGHFVQEFERLAMVGDKKWQHGMAMFFKPFVKATTRYFDHASEAQGWLGEA